MTTASDALLEMTPARLIEQVDAQLGLSRLDLARALAAHPRTIDRWCTGETYPQRAARQQLVRLLNLVHRVREAFATPEGARTWLHAENRYLGGLAPIDAVRVGRFDRVEAALDALDSGIFL